MADVLSNRRNSTRYSLILLATVWEVGGEVKLSARTSDISLTGCYIDTLRPFAKNCRVHLHLTRGDEIFQATGMVMYVNEKLGMGIQFEQPIEQDEMNVLARWLGNSTHLKL